MKSLVIALLCVGTYGASLPDNGFRFFRDIERDSRIVGGELAAIEDAPYQVAMLRLSSGSFFQSCGGSIINPTTIMSASHCTEGTNAQIWTARAGSAQSLSGGQTAAIASYIMHELYNTNPESRWDYDISLYITSVPLVINGVTVAAIKLPTQDQVIADNAIGFIAGWGATQSGGGGQANLRKTDVPIVPNALCATGYGSSVTPRMLCAGNWTDGGVGTCQGDSGGPLTVGGVAMGITSWGRGCGLPGYPAVSARVPAFRTWLDAKVPGGL